MENKEILDLIEKSNVAFENFKKINDEKSSKTEADRKAEMEKAFADIEATKQAIEQLQAKAARPGFGQGANENPAIAEHKEAFNSYVRKGVDYDKSLESKALAISTNSGADGGYAVPKVIDDMIENIVVNISPIRQIADVRQISTSDFHKLVNLKGTGSASVAETASRGATNTPTLQDIKITPYDLYANPQITQQMLDDVFFNAEQWLADEVGEELARQEGNLFVNGNGTNQAQGLLAPTFAATADKTRAFGTVEYLATGTAGAFAASNPGDSLIALVSKLKAKYRAGAKWVLPKSVLFAIAAFKDSTGRYIFNPVSAPNVPATLLGYEVVEAEDVPDITSGSLSVLFGDFKRAYTIVDRVGTRIIRDPFSNKPYIGFYTTKRVGGAVVNTEAYKALKFSAS
jgi:HK97 family phage major capsid protein